MKQALFLGLFFVSTSVAMQLINTSCEVDKKIEELPKIILVTQRGGARIQDCVVCLTDKVFKENQTICPVCTWMSTREAIAVKGLLKHIIKNHSNINLTHYWVNGACKLCNMPMRKSSAASHVINKHIHEISEHRYCPKSMYDKKNDLKLMAVNESNANDSMNIEKEYVQFNLSEIKSGIQSIHANSAFCLLCVKEQLEKRFVVSVDAEPAIVWLQRRNCVESILKFFKLHELTQVMHFMVPTNKCVMCKQDFSTRSLAYHHTLFEHLFTFISHIDPQGNCLNKFQTTQSNEQQKNIFLKNEVGDFLSSDFLNTLI